MIHVLYSTDYELFLGENYVSEKQILIDPTDQLMQACEQADVPLNIFCDVACIWRYRELGMEEFPQLVEEQLRESIKRGHDVQTHLHPHWFDARLEGKRWVYPNEKFLLGKLSEDKSECTKLAVEYLSNAAQYLNGILKEVNPNYRCVAYRAGGFGLQPREDIVFEALQKAGYLIDSSIVPGLVLASSVNQIDFSRVPQLPNYWLSSNSGLSQAAQTGIFEIPIAAAQVGYWDLAKELPRKLINQLNSKPERWESYGKAIQETAVNSQGKWQKLSKKVFQKISKLHRRWFALELRESSNFLFVLTRSYLDKFLKEDPDRDIYFSLISHSKTLSPAMLKALKDYHRRLKKHYGDSLDALTYQQVAKNLRDKKL